MENLNLKLESYIFEEGIVYLHLGEVSVRYDRHHKELNCAFWHTTVLSVQWSEQKQRHMSEE